MEEKVIILKVETKNTKAGAPMWVATTSAGKISSFDKEMADKLFMSINKQLIVETEMQGIFKNLKKIIDNPTPAQSSMPIVQIPQETNISSAPAPATMILSYMKDQVVALIGQPIQSTITNEILDKYWEQAYKNIMENYKKIKKEQ